MKLPSAFDFSRFIDNTTEFSILAPSEVAKKLRELADTLEKSWKEPKDVIPKLVLEEAISIQRAERNEVAVTTLVLSFRYHRDVKKEKKL